MMGWLPRAVATIILALLVLGLASPLVLRGPVLRWAFARVFASCCGHFSIAGGHFGWASAMQFALRQPVSVTLSQLSIADSQGRPVLKAAQVEAVARVRFSPVRIEVIEARIAEGMWRLSSSQDGPGMANPFRPIPAGGRDACQAPTSATRQTVSARAAKPPTREPVQVGIEKARLDNFDLDLGFPSWRLELNGVTTEFWLSRTTDLRFGCGRAVVARGGQLRIGRRGSRGATTVTFDRMAFDSFGTLADAPSDLALVLASARTGRSDLSGRAVFHGVFPGAPPDAPPPGLEVTARWRSFGDGVRRVRASWLPHGKEVKPIEGDLRFAIHGPYAKPNATVALRAAGTRGEATLAQGQANLSLNFSDADTASWFEPGLRRWLGGHLHGRVQASLRLASSFTAMVAELSYANLRLERELATRGPRSLSLRVGPSQPVPLTPEELSLRIRRLALAHGKLRLSDARAAWSQVSAKLDASIDLTPSEGKDTWFEAQGALTVASLADWISTRIVQGRLRAKASLHGTLRSLSLQARFQPSSRLAIRKQRLRLPKRITATLELAGVDAEARFRVNPSLSGRLHLSYLPRWLADAEITLREQSVLPWFSPTTPIPAPGLTGTIRLNYREGHPLVGRAALHVTGPGLEGVSLAARMEGESGSAWIKGRISLAPWRVLWSPYVDDAQGTLGVDVTARHDHRGPHLEGDLVVLRDLVLRAKDHHGAIRLLAGDELTFAGLTFTSPDLHVELPWFHGRVRGRMAVDPSALPKSIMDVGAVGVLNLGTLPMKLPAGVTVRGQAAVELALSGSLGPIPGPRIHGQMNIERLQVRLPNLPTLRLDGLVRAHEDRLSTHGLDLTIAPMGHLAVGAPEAPAWVSVISLVPFRLGHTDARLVGRNLAIGDAGLPIEIRDLDLEARLLGPPGARTLSGQVEIARGTLHRSGARQRGEAWPPRWYRSIPSGLTVDVEFKGFDQALRIEIPALPDVTVNFDCRLRATQQGAHWTGTLYGAGLYDRMALQLHSWVHGDGLQRCEFGPEN